MQSLLSLSLLLSSAAAFSPLVRRQSEKSWAPARETGRLAEDNRMGWSPKPTDLPKPGPRYGGMDLLRRASDFSIGTDTCGFVSGETALPVTCVQPGAYCTDDGIGNMDCCTGQYKACTSSMFSACLDYSASQKGACESAGPRTICCWSDAPSCFTLLMTATATPGKFYSIFQCQTYKGVETLYASPPGLSTSSSSSSSTESTTTSTRTSTSTIQLGGGNTSPPGPNNGGNGSSDNSSAPIGAIVGGAVGGVAAIGLIAFLFFWLIIRNRRNKDNIQGAGPKPPAPGADPTLPPQPQTQPDMAAASTVVGSPMSTYKSPVMPGQPYPPQQQQGQYPGQPEYKAYDPTQQQAALSPYGPNSANTTPSPYGYYPPPGPAQSPPPGPSPQSPNQGYTPYAPPPPQQHPPVVVNELSGESALGTEGHRAELS